MGLFSSRRAPMATTTTHAVPARRPNIAVRAVRRLKNTLTGRRRTSTPVATTTHHHSSTMGMGAPRRQRGSMFGARRSRGPVMGAPAMGHSRHHGGGVTKSSGMGMGRRRGMGGMGMRRTRI